MIPETSSYCWDFAGGIGHRLFEDSTKALNHKKVVQEIRNQSETKSK